MKKAVIIVVIGAAIVAILIFLGIRFFSTGELESAIEEFEDEDYIEAIVMLNHLAKISDYEASEKILYYRCRSVNRLADQLENKFSDELTETSLENKESEDYEETKRELEKYLEKINKKIGGDLVLVPTMKKSRIISRGAFFDEFMAKYRGSSYIEDLNFEEIQKLAKTEPQVLMKALIGFYNKYPNTDYIASMVKMIFDSLQNNTATMTESGEIILDIITSYIRRYPTSPETNRLFTCSGDGVNLRGSPGLQGKPVGKIARDEILIQLEKSMDTSQIGETRDYWYRIASLTGQKGWIFGKFLKPIDISQYKIEEKEERWTLSENFEDWTDSHTPAQWAHVPSAQKESINFKAERKNKVAIVDSPKGKHAGLYSRYNASRAFSLLARARFTGGDSLTIMAYSLGNGLNFSIILRDEEIEISGRKIPIHTGDWHEYLLTSDDGRFAKLLVDGEVISSRIEPVTSPSFSMRGIYCLYSSEKEASKGEMEYLKAR